MRRRYLWPGVFAGVLGWITVITVLILTAPPPGAASPAELADRTAAAVGAGDPQALGELWAPPLDAAYAEQFLGRLSAAGARDLSATGGGDVVVVRGRLPSGELRIELSAVDEGGRWFLSPLPVVRPAAG